jgi:deoxyribodipyrimidine photo-lyase
MRAMVVSFATHNLFLDWRDISHHLACLFLDYEPGIHYPQIQMQAGTTGINAIRIYNPEKQSLDQDPNATFIRTYIPELSNYPLSYIHSPQSLSEMEKILLGIPLSSNYPPPIVSMAESSKKAKDILYKIRKSDSVKSENKKILQSGMTRSKIKK